MVNPLFVIYVIVVCFISLSYNFDSTPYLARCTTTCSIGQAGTWVQGWEMEQERRRGTLQIKGRALRGPHETYKRSDGESTLVYSLFVKTKQSRQDWGVRWKRLCSWISATFVRDAILRHPMIVSPPTRTCRRAICHSREDQVRYYAFSSICHVG
jgi:hypothetical protein